MRIMDQPFAAGRLTIRVIVFIAYSVREKARRDADPKRAFKLVWMS